MYAPAVLLLRSVVLVLRKDYRVGGRPSNELLKYKYNFRIHDFDQFSVDGPDISVGHITF